MEVLEQTEQRNDGVRRGRPPKSTGRILERPQITDDGAREKLWREMWPNARFCLVHNVDFKTGQPNPYPVIEYEAMGFEVLSEDPAIVRWPGHVLMGINSEYFDEQEASRLARANRSRREQEIETVGDGIEVPTDITRSESQLGDLLD